MSDIVSTASIQTPSAPLPVMLAAALRIGAVFVLPWGVQKGWWGQSDVANISALAGAAAAAGWGLYKTHDRQKRLTAVTHGLVGLLHYISHHAPQNAAAEE